MTPIGMLDATGLQNPGVDAVIERYATTWAKWRAPVIVNVAATSVRDYVELARRLDGVPGVAGIELNLSCPNVARDGRPFAIDPDAASAVSAAVRRATDLPLIVKVSADVTDIRPIARAIEDAGADALSAVNAIAGLAVAPDRRAPLLGAGYGGLSGPAIRPIALRVVYEVAQSVRLPIIAAGGVTALRDVLDYLAVGAAAVSVGTAVLADPSLPVELAEALADECARLGHATHRPFIGTALPRRPAGRRPGGSGGARRSCPRPLA
jgi:dihydroorotate dehydrogenase (NAD+) catalytic subunit